MRQKQEPTYSFVILTLILLIVNTVLAWIPAMFLKSGTPGVTLVYIAIGFMILFALWFGLFGAIAAYAGSLLGGLLTNESLMQHPEIALVWAAAGFIEVIIPLVAVRKFDIDLMLTSRRDWIALLIFAVLVNNAAGAAWGVFTLSLLPGTVVDFVPAFVTWLSGNVLVTLLIVPAGLRLFTGKVSRSKLFVKHYWD